MTGVEGNDVGTATWENAFERWRNGNHGNMYQPVPFHAGFDAGRRAGRDAERAKSDAAAGILEDLAAKTYFTTRGVDFDALIGRARVWCATYLKGTG